VSKLQPNVRQFTDGSAGDTPKSPKSANLTSTEHGTEVQPSAFFCLTCSYEVKGDTASHEAGYLHRDNLSRRALHLPIIGKFWHCSTCGISTMRSRVDAHVQAQTHIRKQKEGNSLYMLYLKARLRRFQRDLFRMITYAPAVPYVQAGKASGSIKLSSDADNS